MTKQRKIVIIMLSTVLIGLIVFAVIYQLFIMDKKTKGVVELGRQSQTTYTVADFAKSEMRLYDMGTFHIRIVCTANDTEQVFFVGIGRYEKRNKQYTLTFTEAFGIRNGQLEPAAEIMNKDTVYERKGSNKIRFVDHFHDGQIYYFG
jgi:hypothetical protein